MPASDQEIGGARRVNHETNVPIGSYKLWHLRVESWAHQKTSDLDRAPALAESMIETFHNEIHRFV
jgi:hypothetical protein